MITFLPVLFALLLSAYVAMAPPQQVKLAWDWDMTGQHLGECSFRIYQTTNLSTPPGNWLVVTNIQATNAWTGSNFLVPLMIVPGQYFWVVTVSNFWAESDISNVVNAPPVALSPNLKLTR